MKSMRRIQGLSTVLLILALAVGLSGCDSTSTDEVQPFDLEVKVTYPDEYNAPIAEGATVKAASQTRDTTFTAKTDENGIAFFEGLSPGPYSLSASRELTASEAGGLTGTAASVDLSGTLPTETLEGPSDSPLQIQLGTTGVGTFVFSEVYYTGSALPEGDTYFRDQFFELYNNTGKTLEADGLYIGVVHGASGQINPRTEPTPFQDEEDAVYVEAAWQVPDDNVTVEPGGTLVIAQHGINHANDPNGNPDSPVNLGDADFEMYTGKDEDTDVNGVPNMNRRYFDGGFYSLVPVFGPALILFRTDDFASLERKPVPGASFYGDRIRVPNDLIIDSFEALQGPNSGDYMRIPLDVNAGFVSTGDTYTSESAERLIDTEVNGRPVLENTNNTGNDFEITDTPTPGTVQ